MIGYTVVDYLDDKLLEEDVFVDYEGSSNGDLINKVKKSVVKKDSLVPMGSNVPLIECIIFIKEDPH